jgi:hypothetical protein
MYSMKRTVKCLRLWRAVLLCLLAVCCADRVIADSPASQPRRGPALLVGFGGASLSNPDPHRFTGIDPRPGFRAGLLISSPESRLVSLDIGLLLDVRGAATHSSRWNMPPDSRRIDYRRTYTLTYVTTPLHLRFSATRAGSRPYVTFGPELSLLLLAGNTVTTKISGQAYSHSEEFTESAEQYSVGLYLGVGLTRAINERDYFMELGLSMGLEGVGGDSRRLLDGSSGITNARPRLFALSMGMAL